MFVLLTCNGVVDPVKVEVFSLLLLFLVFLELLKGLLTIWSLCKRYNKLAMREKNYLRFHFAEALMSEFFWKFSRNLRFDLAQSGAHFVFLLLLLLNLTESGDSALGNLVRVFHIVLQLLVT